MNWQRKLTIGLVILFSICSSTKPLHADGIVFGINGELWNYWDTKNEDYALVSKLAMLRGTMEGLMYGQSPLIESDAIYMNMGYDKYAEALDEFYSDYRNDKIFIVWAIIVISMEMRGTPSEEVEGKILEFRKLCSDLDFSK